MTRPLLPARRRGDRLKRALDVFLAIVALVPLMPVLILVALVVRMDSPGPILYASDRVGQNWRRFRLLKFRTMRVDADRQRNALASSNLYRRHRTTAASCEECLRLGRPCTPHLHADGGRAKCERSILAERRQDLDAPFFKIAGDPRVTRVGRFLRMTSLDELPQLWNVLRGDISLVGNRPLPIDEAERLTHDGGIERFLAPAGLTGLWQVEQRSRVDVSPEERIRLDNLYSRTRTLLGDLRIVLRTVPALVQRDSR